MMILAVACYNFLVISFARLEKFVWMSFSTFYVFHPAFTLPTTHSNEASYTDYWFGCIDLKVCT
jgi:hypothetical protein